MGVPVTMAEPLTKHELSSRPDNPQPFRNQELGKGSPGIDSAPSSSELRVETLSSNVVELRPPIATDGEDAVAATGTSALDNAAQKYREAQESVVAGAEWVRDSAIQGVDRARRRLRYWADEYPLQLLAAIAGAGFLTGVLVRIWRSKNYEQ